MYVNTGYPPAPIYASAEERLGAFKAVAEAAEIARTALPRVHERNTRAARTAMEIIDRFMGGAPVTNHALGAALDGIRAGASARNEWDSEGARAEFAVFWAMLACMTAYAIAWIDQATPIQDYQLGQWADGRDMAEERASALDSVQRWLGSAKRNQETTNGGKS